MTELMPVNCWNTPSPTPMKISRRIQRTPRSEAPPVWAARSSSASAWTSAISASARSGERTWRSTSSASSSRSLRTSQRGLSGIRSMPTNSAIAGSTATASMERQTPSFSPQTWKMIALMMNAANCPLTIMTSLRVTMLPRRSYGAISER